MKTRILVALIIALTIAFAVPFTERQFRLAQEREKTRLDLYGILDGLLCYSEMRAAIPPTILRDHDGLPLSSWRFASASFLLGDEVQVGYYGQWAQLHKPWDSPENSRYLSGPYREYRGCPLSYIDQTRPGDKARFVAVHGLDTAFEEAKRRLIKELPPSLILVVETRGCMKHWMEPGGDLDVKTMPRQLGAIGSIGPCEEGKGEFFVGFADLTVRLIRTDIQFETLAMFLTITGAKQHDRNELLSPHTIRVWNPLGMN
jgi:hypothetical protein